MCRFSFYLPFVGPTQTNTRTAHRQTDVNRRVVSLSVHTHTYTQAHLSLSFCFFFSLFSVSSVGRSRGRCCCCCYWRCSCYCSRWAVISVDSLVRVRDLSVSESVRERERARKQWFQSGFKFLSTCVCFLTVQLRLLVCFDFGFLAARNLCAA